jgi:hypothetical protein
VTVDSISVNTTDAAVGTVMTKPGSHLARVAHQFLTMT